MNVEVIICVGIWTIAIAGWNVSSLLKRIANQLHEIDIKMSKEYKW